MSAFDLEVLQLVLRGRCYGCTRSISPLPLSGFNSCIISRPRYNATALYHRDDINRKVSILRPQAPTSISVGLGRYCILVSSDNVSVLSYVMVVDRGRYVIAEY